MLSVDDFPCLPANPDAVDRWCAHLPGDTVIATTDREQAELICNTVNEVLRSMAARSENDAKFGAAPTAHPCAWPWGAQSWQEERHDWESWRASDRTKAGL